MENNLAKLVEKQIRWQKITAILLAVFVAVLLLAGIYIGTAAHEIAEVLGELDVNSINQTFFEIDEFANSVNEVTGDMKEVAETFSAIVEVLNGFKSKLFF